MQPLKRPGLVATPRRRRRGRVNSGRLMMLPVMPVIVMGALATPLAAHCHAASLAQLPGLGLHTGRDLRHVGNNVGTKPHRVGRTCLSNGIARLGICAIRQAKRHGRHDGKYARSIPQIDFCYRRLAALANASRALRFGLLCRQSRKYLLAQRWRKYDLVLRNRRVRYFAGTVG